MPYMRNKEAITQEIKMFWEHVRDKSNTPGVNNVLTGDFIDKLYERHPEAHTIVVDSYNDLLNSIHQHEVRPNHRGLVTRTLVRHGERYALKLLDLKVLEDQIGMEIDKEVELTKKDE